MGALERFVDWLSTYTFADRNKRLPPGLKLQYHSRSDAHSKRLAELIVDDLLDHCAVLRDQALRGEVAYSINHFFVWPNGKSKTIDLAIGIPRGREAPTAGTRIRRLPGRPRVAGDYLHRLLIACEEKAVMTEHSKSQPRIYSELNDSHAIVHRGSRDTIAAGIAMVNIAATFVSPLRQRRDQPIVVTPHLQPQVTESMVRHLRKLPIRETMDGVGLDAYFTFVVNVDNQGHVALHTDPPAPQPGDPDHYEAFLNRVSRIYAERYGDLENLPAPEGLGVEESLVRLAEEHPGLLDQTGQLAVDSDLDGAPELHAILQSVERQANPPGGEADV